MWPLLALLLNCYCCQCTANADDRQANVSDNLVSRHFSFNKSACDTEVRDFSRPLSLVAVKVQLECVSIFDDKNHQSSVVRCCAMIG